MRNLRVVLAGAGITVLLAACGNGPPPSVVSSSAAGGSAADGTVVTNPASVAVTIEAKDDLQFHPGTQTAKVGDVVQWTNTGSAPHNITFDAADDALTNHSFDPGTKYAVKWTKAGTYSYKCTLHPGMNGQITVS